MEFITQALFSGLMLSETSAQKITEDSPVVFSILLKPARQRRSNVSTSPLKKFEAMNLHKGSLPRARADTPQNTGMMVSSGNRDGCSKSLFM
ncbi:MAG: hypothetical protein ACK4WF_09980, partial [Candidatus Brocadiales bacterium]